MPVVVGLVLCGVQVILLPDTQYAYFASPSSVATLPEVWKVPLVEASTETTPAQPVWLTVAAHVHSLPAADVQVTES